MLSMLSIAVALAVAGAGSILVFWLFASPQQVIEFPVPEGKTNTKRKNQSIALAASYNPPHVGHVTMLGQLAREFENVVAIIAFNPNKTYAVTPQKRKQILLQILKDTGANNVTVEIVQGYAWSWCAKNNVQWLARGIRSFTKDGLDEKILELQNLLAPIFLGPLDRPVRTFYLKVAEGSPLANISSTVVRKRLDEGLPINDLIPEESPEGAKMIVEATPWQ